MRSGSKPLTTGDVINNPELGLYDPTNKETSWMDSYGASFEADSSVLNYLNSLETDLPPEEGYNPVPDVPPDMTYYMDEYLQSRSPGETEQITGRIRYEQKRSMDAGESISASILGSLSGTLFGSPEYLPLMFTGIGALGRTGVAVGRAAKTFGAVRHAQAAAKLGAFVAAEETVHEAILHQSTRTRTLTESGINIAAATLFGTTIGGVHSAFTRGRYVDQLSDLSDDAFNGVYMKRMNDYIEPNEKLIINGDQSAKIITDTGSTSSTKTFASVLDAEDFLKERAGVSVPSVGAAYTGRGLDEAPKRAKWRNSEVMRKSPLRSGNIALERPMLNARSPRAHEVTAQTWGHDKPTLATEAGYAKTFPVSREAGMEVGLQNHALKRDLYDGYFEWIGKENKKMMRLRTHVTPSMRKSWQQFNDEVDWAMRNNNKSQMNNPIVARTATKISSIFTKAKDDAVKEGIYGYRKVPVRDERGDPVVGDNGKMMMRDEAIDPAVSVKYANSWAPRGWNPRTLRGGMTNAHDELRAAFKKERIDIAAETDKAELADRIIKVKQRIQELKKTANKEQGKLDKQITKATEQLSDAEKVKIEWGHSSTPTELLRKAKADLKRLEIARAKLKTKPAKEKKAGQIKTAREELKKVQTEVNKARSAETKKKTNISRRKRDLGKLQTKQKNAIKNTAKSVSKLDAKVTDLEKSMSDVGNSKWLDKKINEDDLFEDLEGDVIDSFTAMVYGKVDGRVFGDKASKAGSTKERMIPIHDNIARENDWFDTNILNYGRNYLESTIRPTLMKRLHGDTEMKPAIDSIVDDYGRMAIEARDAGDTKLANSLLKEGKEQAGMQIAALNRYYHRSLVPDDPKAIGANLSRLLRDFNVMIRMGGVTPTSLSDVGRYNMAKIYAPEIGRFGTTVRDAIKSGKYNNDTLQDFGIAHEVSGNVRAAKYLDIDDPIPADWKITDLADKGAYGLMRATLLSEFTDGGKLTVANLTTNEMWRMAKNWSKLTDKTKGKLANLGFDEELAEGMRKEFAAGNIKYIDNKNHAVAANYGTWNDQDLAKRFTQILFKESERILGTPNELTSPLWADSNMGKLLLQFKSFSLAAHQQVTTPLADKARHGDILAYQTIATALAMGVITEVIKAAIAGEDAWDRLDDYTASDWVYAAIDRSAMIPLLMVGFNGMDTFLQTNLSQALNRTPRGRPSRHAWETAMGPTPALITTAYWGLSELLAGNFDQRDLHAIRTLLPFNNLAWIARGVDKLEEAAGAGLGLPSGKKKSRSLVQ